MARNSFPKALDAALRPFGFEKQGDDWIRVRGDMWECVNRQSSWLGGVTANLLIKDLATEKLYLEIFGVDAGGMPPIQERIGQLVDGYDRWWTKDEPDGPRQMADAVVEYGLPWFDRVRTPEEQAENWFARRTALAASGYHGRSLIGLALTLYRLGQFDEACQVLQKPVPRTAIPASVRAVARVRDWMQCPQTNSASVS